MNAEVWYPAVIEAGIDLQAPLAHRLIVPVITEALLLDPETVAAHLPDVVRDSAQSLAMIFVAIVASVDQVPTRAIPMAHLLVDKLRLSIRVVVEHDCRDYLAEALLVESLTSKSLKRIVDQEILQLCPEGSYDVVAL